MSLVNILNSPEVAHTLAALPDDPRLAALRSTCDTQAERLAAARARPIAVDARIAAIDRALIDADEKAQRALLGERGLLREERASQPVRLLEEGKRAGVAELAVLGHLAALIRPYGVEAARELAPLEGRANYVHAQITNVESSHLNRPSKTERMAAHRAELAAMGPRAQELNERIRLVEYGLGSIRAHAKQQYGERADPANVHTYGEAVEAFARRMVRAAGVA